ncbi:hypothetical protein ACI78Q_22975 [Geodermatophilus sp. SYSU D00705]
MSRPVEQHDGAWEAQELARRCSEIEDPAVQGLPLLRGDYVALLVVTVLVPLVLVLIGSLM